MLSARSLRKGRFGRPPDEMFANYGAMLGISLWAYAVTGMFLEFASFDLYYQIVAALVIAKVLADQQHSSAAGPARTRSEPAVTASS